MSAKKPTLCVLLLWVILPLLSACQSGRPTLVTFDGWDRFDIPTLDPQIAQDVVSVDAIENLFLQLTNHDLETAQIVPEAATRWQVSDDGLTYTFFLRADIPWVRYDPRTSQARQEIDPQGHPRFLTAHDFVFGIRRACDPNTGSYYSTVVAPLLKGCADVLFVEDPAHISQELWDAVGVRAPDDHTLVIKLAFPASYFLSMTPMWTLAAAPRWAIEEHGKAWIDPEHIVTNGRYLLQQWEKEVQRTLVRNALLPADLRGAGNIERIVISVIADHETGYNAWLENKVDYSSIPENRVEAHLERFPDETERNAEQAVSYIGFRMTKAPFDDARVRRAFAAAFDRETYIQEVLHGLGLPMIHFAPPGTFGAPPIDEVGVGFDPEFARQQLAAAGYPDCEGLPRVVIASFETLRSLSDYARSQWTQHLGCGADRIAIMTLSFGDLVSMTENTTPDAQAPHMWALGWTSDYPDENNWVGDVLWCKATTRQKRACNEIDALIVQARENTDPQRRVALYRQIEEQFFGPAGEMPLIPVRVGIGLMARHAWLERPPAPFGGEQWYTWTIDHKAKQAARR